MSLEGTISEASVIMGLISTNIVAIVSAFISLKVGVTRLEVKVDKLEVDANNLGRITRELRLNNQGEKPC